MTRILHIGEEARLDSAFSQRLQTWRGTIGLHVACPERCLEEKAPGGSARGTAGEASRTRADNQALRDIPPNVAGAVETPQRTIRDANRASEVLKRLREMFSNKEPVVESVDLNDAVREVIAIAVGELTRRSVRLQTELAEGLPALSANRGQLQQVILNLLLNAADGIDDRSRSLLVRTKLEKRWRR